MRKDGGGQAGNGSYQGSDDAGLVSWHREVGLRARKRELTRSRRWCLAGRLREGLLFGGISIADSRCISGKGRRETFRDDDDDDGVLIIGGNKSQRKEIRSSSSLA